MQAKVKCSECGAEITNLSMNWGYKHLLIMMPFLLLALFPLWRLMGPKGDYREELQITVQETRTSDNYLNILGAIENKGSKAWEHVHINAEFFNAEGKFIDEETGLLSATIHPGETENFKIKIFVGNQDLTGDDIEMRVKVADAHSPLM